MNALPMVALQLRFAGKFGSSKECTRISGDVGLWRELGKILSAINGGADARSLFRQNERTKPRRDNQLSIGLVYWYMRAIEEKHGDAETLKIINAATVLNAPESKATIRKIAQRVRKDVLNVLKNSVVARRNVFDLQSLIHGLVCTESSVDENLSSVKQVIAHVNAIVPPITAKKLIGLEDYLRNKSQKQPG